MPLVLFCHLIRSDEGWSASPDANLIANFDQFVVSDYNYGNVYGLWTDFYFGVNRANQVLDNVPNIKMDAGLKARYLGEAHFYVHYFIITWQLFLVMFPCC